MYSNASPSIKRRVFYSFHYKKDAWRAGQIRNIGAIEGNSPVSDNDWEKVKRGKYQAIKRWIDDNMKERSCLIVLVGEETATRPWIEYEIERAWNTGMGIVGIYIHNIKDRYSRLSQKGKDPFESVVLNILNNGIKLSYYVKCFEPNPNDAYNDIAENLEVWVEDAIEQRRRIGSLLTIRKDLQNTIQAETLEKLSKIANSKKDKPSKIQELKEAFDKTKEQAYERLGLPND